MRKNLLSSNLVKSSALLPIGTALNFVLTLVVARQLPTGDFGFYSAVISFANILAVLCSLGLPISAQMRIPTYSAAGREYLTAAYLRVCIATIAIVVAVGIVVAIIGFRQSSNYFFVLPVCVIACLIWIFQRYIALGFDRVTQAIIPRDILFHMVMIVLFFIGVTENAVNSLLLYAGMLLVLTTPVLIYQLRAYPLFSVARHKDSEDKGYWALIVDSVPFAIVRLGQLGTTGAEIVVMSFFLPLELVGIYAFIFKFTLAGSLINRIVNVANGQRFAMLYSSGKIDSFRKLFFKSMILSVCVSGVLFLFVLIFGKYVLGLVKEEFLSGYPVLLILIAGQVIGASMGPTTIALNMIGQQRKVAVITCVVAAISIGACSVAAPRYELVGVAVIVSSSLVLSKVLQLLFLNRKLGGAFGE